MRDFAWANKINQNLKLNSDKTAFNSSLVQR